MEHFEKTIESETLYKGKVVTLRLDKVQLENNNTAMREIVCHNGGSCVIAMNDQKEIYLIKQYRHAFEKEILELPAGKLEIGEDPFEAAKRELKEETGIQAENYYDLGVSLPTVGYCSEKIYIYGATKLTQQEQSLDPDEFVTLIKLPFEQCVSMVMSGEIEDAKTVIGILKFKNLLDDGKIEL